MIRFYSYAVLLHAYVAWRLIPDMQFGAVGIVAFSIWLILSAALIPLGFRARRIRRQPLSDRVGWAGLFAMGSFSSLLVLTFLRDVVLLISTGFDRLVPGQLPLQTLVHYSASIVVIGALVSTLVGFLNARRRARVKSVEVPISGLPASLHGFTIAQISDMHVGPTIKRNYVEAVVDAVNDLNADMVAVTGDLVDGSVARLSHDTEPLSKLSARHGAYFVTGNHEYYSGAEAWVAEVRRLGLRVLMNEHVVVQHEGAAVVVAGVTDYSAHHFDPSQRSDPARAIAGAPGHANVKLLLAHQPRSAFAAEQAGYDLQLSGHTHGGQFWPWNLFVRLQQPFTAGLHRLGRMWIYISRGTGYWGPPMRFGIPSEITRIRLVRA